MRERFCHSVLVCKCLDKLQLCGVPSSNPKRLVVLQFLCGCTHKDRPSLWQSACRVHVGTSHDAVIDAQLVDRHEDCMPPAAAKFSGQHLQCSEDHRRLPCAPAIHLEVPVRPANWPMPPPKSLHATHLWVRAQIDREPFKDCSETPQRMLQIVVQMTASASSKPEMNASSTRWPRHQSPHTPMPCFLL